jgi:uncharacterized membrane protein (DUF485 family)
MIDLGSKFSSFRRKRRGMALPLVILLVIVGFVFVGVGAYVVRNLFWSSQGVVIESKLYNAAQSGIEWGMEQIWANKDQIESDTITSVDAIEDLRVRLDDLSSGTANGAIVASGGYAYPGDTNVSVSVLLLDCNYTLKAGASVSKLPPKVPNVSASGGTGTSTIPPGTSVIIDPSRFLPLGGGVTEHAFVIRSTATGWGRSTELESMVVIKK